MSKKNSSGYLNKTVLSCFSANNYVLVCDEASTNANNTKMLHNLKC